MGKGNEKRTIIVRKHLGKQPAGEILLRIIKDINENLNRETYAGKQ